MPTLQVEIVPPPVVSFASMPVGTVLTRSGKWVQRVERCPRCGRPGKHHLTGIAAESWIHEQRGVVATVVCTIGR